ncbi:hypothetical protein [Anaerococcus vaginalis]|uniref:hypothetical protein n=1 Tax=Anaerococcus vaginalis TaxID=33037 RepID=UPI0022E00266|nr:hypothetical protein [Anaerococcus vaginalis]
MKLNKILITALSISLLVGCQDKNTDTKTETPSSVQETTSVEKNSPSSNANKEQKQGKEKTIMDNPSNKAKILPQSEEEKSKLPIQVIQQQPGENQKEHYVLLQNGAVQYQQTGDAFLVDSEIHKGSKVLVIPFKFKNITSDVPLKPSEPMMILTNAIQKGDNVNYDIYISTYANRDYKNDSSISVNAGGEVDYYLMYELKDPTLGLQIIDKKSDTVVAEFKPE